MASVPSIAHEVTTLARRLDERLERGIADEIDARSEKLETTTADLLQRINAMDVRGNHTDVAIGEIWERIEFVRREILFEFNHGSEKVPPNGTEAPKNDTRIVSAEKFETALGKGQLRLNLGCGHIALDDYINVDARDLLGVDIIADVGDLPVREHCVDEIFSAHLIEHFPLETMRRRLLPYWRSRLRSGGTFRAVTPDAAAMVQATAAGTMPFDDFREVTYGTQDYDGDYHFNLFTPDSLQALLQEAGFERISVPVAGRRNGKCFEFEIVATAP
jgi:hypothetical protein